MDHLLARTQPARRKRQRRRVAHGSGCKATRQRIFSVRCCCLSPPLKVGSIAASIYVTKTTWCELEADGLVEHVLNRRRLITTPLDSLRAAPSRAVTPLRPDDGKHSSADSKEQRRQQEQREREVKLVQSLAQIWDNERQRRRTQARR